MKLCRHVLLFLIMTAMATLPLAGTAAAQEVGSQKGNLPITASEPRMMATAEEPMPAEKKPGIGKYMLFGALGVALVALAAGGGGGGGGGGGTSTTTGDSGTVEVGW